LEDFDGEPVHRYQRIPHGADLRGDLGEKLSRAHPPVMAEDVRKRGSGSDARRSYLREAERWVRTVFGLAVGLGGSSGTVRTVLACVPNPCLGQRGARLWTDLGRGTRT
jgi:hypothetical protein